MRPRGDYGPRENDRAGNAPRADRIAGRGSDHRIPGYKEIADDALTSLPAVSHCTSERTIIR